jgi:hypothetical protein
MGLGDGFPDSKGKKWLRASGCVAWSNGCDRGQSTSLGVQKQIAGILAQNRGDAQLESAGNDYLMLTGGIEGRRQRAREDHVMDLYPSARYITLGN